MAKKVRARRARAKKARATKTGAVRTRPGKWRVRCPVCKRPRIIKEGRNTVIHNCKCETLWKANCDGSTTILSESEGGTE